MFCEENAGKMNAKGVELFAGRVSPRIPSLDSADYLQEQVNTSLVEKQKSINEQNFDGESNWSGVVFK